MDDRLLVLAQTTIDTREQPSVSDESQSFEFARRILGLPCTHQWYVQVSPGFDFKWLGNAYGVHYVPNNAFVMVATQQNALNISKAPGVLWVGRRSPEHKIDVSDFEVIESVKKREAWQSRRWWRIRSDMEASDEKTTTMQVKLSRRQTAIVLLVNPSLRASCHSQPQIHCTSKIEGVPAAAKDIVEVWKGEFIAQGIRAQAEYVSEEKALVRILAPDHVVAAYELLAARPEVFYVESKINLYPHNAGAVRLLQEGPDDASRTKDTSELAAVKRGINGSGQILGIADTGIDWDNCFFWESAKSPTFPDKGMEPPLQRVERERRKLVGYRWYTDCTLCDRCPIPVEEDYKAFTEVNGLLIAGGAWKGVFPTLEAMSREPPRLYDTAGAAVFYNITAQTQRVPSEFLAQGGGAFDFPVHIQVFVLRRRDMASFTPSNPDLSKCLNDCSVVANRLETATAVGLEATNGGYGVIVYNKGLVVDANILLKGEIQFMTARKPCGDNGDDRAGHGTHVSGAAAGAAFGPASRAAEVQEAAAYNGLASGAQIYFTDVMQNADPNCNVPGLVCTRVAEMTVPLDTKRLLYQPAYDAGARVQLNSWGCKRQSEESVTTCNRYDTNAQDLDAFAWEHPDWLAVTAVGDAGDSWASGTVASPATCKNCLSVGASDIFNEEYRESVRFRDPMEDMCDCKYPRSCSQSESIKGAYVDSSNREQLLGEVPDCCDDRVVAEHVLTDQEIPSRQSWSVFLPNMSFFDPNVQQFVRDNYRWAQDGASIDYDYHAESRVFSTPNYEVSPATIQVQLSFDLTHLIRALMTSLYGRR